MYIFINNWDHSVRHKLQEGISRIQKVMMCYEIIIRQQNLSTTLHKTQIQTSLISN